MSKWPPFIITWRQNDFGSLVALTAPRWISEKEISFDRYAKKNQQIPRIKLRQSIETVVKIYGAWRISIQYYTIYIYIYQLLASSFNVYLAFSNVLDVCFHYWREQLGNNFNFNFNGRICSVVIGWHLTAFRKHFEEYFSEFCVCVFDETSFSLV